MTTFLTSSDLTKPIPPPKHFNSEDGGTLSKMLVSTHKTKQFHSPEVHNLNFKICIGSLTRIGMERFQFLHANICHN
jgi:hypothetical protein